MKAIAIFSVVLLGSSLSAIGQTVSCEDYKDKIVLWAEDFRGGEDIRIGKQDRPLWLADFLDNTSFQGVPSMNCEEKSTERPACWVDVYDPTIYDNGIVLERGQSNDYIWLHNGFPTTPTGIRAGMSKQEVVSLLGRGSYEAEKVLHYRLTSNYGTGRVKMFFQYGKLALIQLINWKAECQE